VNVFPILKKYGMKATIFVSPDFVDPGKEVRANFDDVASNDCDPSDLQTVGFLNWPEMRAMERSGLVDIQSHAMTHTWYFSGPRIVGFHTPHSVTPYPWLFWNARPDRKPFYLSEDQQEFLPWGYPIFEHEKSLAATRFFPDDDAVADLTMFVSSWGGKRLFDQADWQERLESHLSKYLGPAEFPGHYETEEERAARISDELGRSKKLIEMNLDKTVDFICWPGGANDDFVIDQARSAGYKSWTLGSRKERRKRNCPGEEPAGIRRIGTSNTIDVRGRKCGDAGPYYQLFRVFAHQGSLMYALAIKASKLIRLATSYTGKWL
jgi:peptidoglycan/xylan/chitin deacetylase (PgdA/CDA1 family)